MGQPRTSALAWWSQQKTEVRCPVVIWAKQQKQKQWQWRLEKGSTNSWGQRLHRHKIGNSSVEEKCRTAIGRYQKPRLINYIIGQPYETDEEKKEFRGVACT